jgi:protein-glutamine gamma-glutamyltransferase
MALLLRMGGVPARVAVGFTHGTYDSVTGRWVVSDEDAHAWVEAWFPTYGWVRFDPTPSADPALAPHASLPTLSGSAGSAGGATAGKHLGARTASGTVAGGTRAGGSRGGGLGVPLLALAVIAIGGLLAAALVLTRPLDSDERRIAELERAFARTGRPLSGGVTLAALEHRLRGSTGAAGYIRTLRLRRFGASSGRPSSAERRALRAELRAGLGPLGRVRALWALPPRRRA